MTPAITVDRANFIAWTEGILLKRQGKIIKRIGDNKAHELAEQAMDNGKTIALTIGGCVVSYMRIVDGAYTEFRA